MSNEKIKKIALAGLFIALTLVATLIKPPIPMVSGYVHLGDSIIFLASLIFGSVFGAITGGIGSALADIFSGYAIYAPATLVIKASMGFLFAGLLNNGKWSFKSYFVILTTFLILVGGYYIYEAFVVLKSFVSPIANIPYSIAQYLLSAIVGLLLYKILKNKI